MSKLDKFIFTKVNGSLGHIIKRDDIVWWKAWLIRIVSVILALIVCGIVTISLTDLNPLKCISP